MLPKPHDLQRKYVLISPCRNEAKFMRATLDSVIAQTERPSLWVVVDDGSSDRTPEILDEYAGKHDWIKIVKKPDRGSRAVGPGVIEAFNFGLRQVDLLAFNYLCKLDLDLDLPTGYFAALMDRMGGDPRLGSCSGKPYFRNSRGSLVSERCGDELSVGMTKFYRRECFEQINGFVQQVMWDAIDCHRSRLLGWKVRSWDEPELRFVHLRPMGSSEKGVLTGRMRHGFGQYFMGSDFLYFTATCFFRMWREPAIIGSLAMWWGYVRSWLRGSDKLTDAELRSFIRSYQRRALLFGKRDVIAKIEADYAGRWPKPVVVNSN